MSAVILAAWLGAATAVLGQTPVIDPIGLTRISCLSNSDTFVSTPLTRPPEFSGTIQSISGNVITVAGAPGWNANRWVFGGSQTNHYYALIGRSVSNDPKEGHMYVVSGNSTNTLTVSTAVETLTGIPANAQITLIPFWTLSTVFPLADENISFTATTSTQSYKTQIRIPNDSVLGINFPYSPVYFFSRNVDGTASNVGWRMVGDNNRTDHGNDTIVPDSYFIVRNGSNAPTLPLACRGPVLLKRFASPLVTQAGSPLDSTKAQDNAVSLLRPIDVTLDNSGLTPLNNSFVANDQLLLFDNTKVGTDKSPSRIYYYDTSVGNAGGWRLNGGGITNRGNDVIPAGTGFVVRKAATSTGGNIYWTNDFPVPAPIAVSRKSHRGSTFDIGLPFTGNPGIECRSGGSNNDHQIVITFPTAVTFSSASVTSGTGSISSTSGSGTRSLIVNLTGVANAQTITVTLHAVNDGVRITELPIPMSVLAGDTTSDGSVNSADITQTKSQSGVPVSSANFRIDVTVDGSINSADITFVKLKSGSALP